MAADATTLPQSDLALSTESLRGRGGERGWKIERESSELMLAVQLTREPIVFQFSRRQHGMSSSITFSAR